MLSFDKRYTQNKALFQSNRHIIVVELLQVYVLTDRTTRLGRFSTFRPSIFFLSAPTYVLETACICAIQSKETFFIVTSY